jgi:hypothetical protein
MNRPACMIQAVRGESVLDTFCAKQFSPLACNGLGPLISPCMGTRSERRAARHLTATNHEWIRQAGDHAGCQMT